MTDLVAKPPLAPLALTALVGCCAIFGLWEISRPPPENSDTNPGLLTSPRLDAPQNAVDLATWAILDVAQAFEAPSEAAIRASLIGCCGQDVVDELVATDRAALADNGLSAPAIGLHEIELEGLDARQTQSGLDIAASWHVLGLVDPDAHTHMVGARYSANIALERDANRWWVTGFDVTAADKTRAGAITASAD